MLDYKLDISPLSPESDIMLDKFSFGINYFFNDKRIIILKLKGIETEYTISTLEYFSDSLDEKLKGLYSNITENNKEINIHMMKEYKKDLVLFQK